MKALILNGSPKGKTSNTVKLCNQFVEGMKQVNPDLTLIEYDLSKMNLKSCTGCYSCWNNAERKCAIKDDMTEMFKAYIDADIIIWSTPLYYYSMTSLTKTFIERLLPTNSPLIIHTGEEYSHPPLFDSAEEQKHVVISTCGFPEYHNFDLLEQNMIKMVGATPENMVFSVMGELFSAKGLTSTISWYLDGVKDAGKEFMKDGFISESTRDLLSNPLVPVDAFLEMANNNFECQKIDAEKFLGEKNDSEGKGFRFLKQMKTVFNKNNGLNLNADIEFEFTDTKENCYFTINQDKIELTQGRSTDSKLKIITSLSDWKKISDGDLNGSQALADGIYKIKGSLEYLQKLDTLFGSSSKPDVSKPKVEQASKFYGIKAESWMSLSFIPWILSWVLFDFSPVLASVIPLAISLIILMLKKRVKAVTYFEMMSGLHFFFMTAFTYFFKNEALQYGAYINYFSIAAIWALSTFSNISLTAEYSRHTEGNELVGNPLFDKTNVILTLFWSLIFVIQGVLKYWLISQGLVILSYSVYALVFVALYFTKFFSKWYPQHLATRG